MVRTTVKRMFLGAALWAGVASAQAVDRVAAVVNNEIIPMSEVEQRASVELARVKAPETDPAARAKAHSQVVHQALDQIVAEKLMDAEIKEAHLEPTDVQVNAAVEEMKKENNLTDDQLKVELQRQGYTQASYRQFMKRELARLDLFRMKLEPKVKISDQDLRAEYQREQQEAKDSEIHVRHIVVSVPASATAAQRAAAHEKALGIADKARAPGADFAELAKTSSQGSSAAGGGDLGFFQRGTMEADFERVAFSLKKGEVSAPVETKFGWHIIKMEERRAASLKPFAEMKQELSARLRQMQMSKLAIQYVQQLREGASVDVKI